MLAPRSVCSRCSPQLRTVAAASRPGGALARFATAADKRQTPSPLDDLEQQMLRQRKTDRDETSRKKGQDSALALFADVVKAKKSSKPKVKSQTPSPQTDMKQELLPQSRTEEHAKSRAEAQDPAVALFVDVVSAKKSHEPVVMSEAEPAAFSELELIANLNHLVRRNGDLVRDYEVFRKQFWPHIEKTRSRRVQEAAVEVLGRVRSHISWVKLPQQGSRAIALEMAQMYNAMGKDDFANRHEIVINLCHTLVDKAHPTSRRRLLMTDLIGLWQHMSQLRRRDERDRELRFALPNDRDVIKDLDNIAELSGNEGANPSPSTVKRALTSLFTLFAPAHAESILPGLLATMAILSDKRYTTQTMQTEAAPLLHLFQLVFMRLPGGLTPEAVDAIFLKRNTSVWAKQQQLRGYVVNQLPQITKMLLYESDKWQSGVHEKADVEMDGALRLATFHKQLRLAYWARNTGAILSIWQNLRAALQDKPRLGDDIRYDPHFLDFWVFVWCAVRRSSKLQETIDLMQELEIEPTVKTYTSMMHGWKMTKETDKIDALWSQLLQSGMKLDVVIWTERISALIDGGRTEQGVEELKHMVSAWKKAAVAGTEGECVEPTIAVVNAVLKGLLRQGDAQRANAALRWAGKEGFQPDVRTYNILLRETLREDRSGDAKSLLQSMKDAGIDPDSATFTILLEVVLGRMGPDVKPEEQIEAISGVFEEFKASGIKPGLETYGKMLYAVSSLAEGSDAAVDAVLEHMKRAGYTITVYMVTILIERALDQRKPDIDKVRELLRDYKLVNLAHGDQTLWERVMSAYAIGGHRDDAVTLFDRLSAAGRAVTSLPCLTDLLRMLLELGDDETARRVVKVVLKNKMKRGESQNERYWKHHFWHMARESGLLKGLDVPYQDFETI